MSGSSNLFNVARGKIGYYASLPAANDGLVLVLFRDTGLQADDTLRDHTTLASITGAGNTECSVSGYARKIISGATPTINNVTNKLTIDFADQVWTTPASGQTLAKAVVCYDPDITNGSNDAEIIPLTYHSFDKVLDGTTLTAVVTDFYESADV